MPSQTEVANFALAQIGHAPITNLDDPDAIARRVKRLFDIILDAMTADHVWNWAYTRVELAALPDLPISEFGYQYNKPGDSIRIIKIGGSTRTRYREEGGRILTSNAPPLLVEYLRRETDPNKWGGAFTLALATHLASALAGNLKNDLEARGALYEQYLRELFTAKQIDSQSQSVEAIEVPELIRVRSN